LPYNSKETVEDTNSFTFSINHGGVVLKTHNESVSIQSNDEFFLKIGGHLMIKNNSYLMDDNYADIQLNNNEGGLMLYYLTGSKKFKVNEIEVFTF
jgi:hypothetical protein